MKTVHAGVVVLYGFCACVTGCAAPGTSTVATGTAAPFRANIISAQNARDAISIGKSTKADVLAALGNTMVISFDSGFEVWVYRIKEADTPPNASREKRFEDAGSEKGTLGKTEFVVLFAPSGVVTKTRIRPAPPPVEARGA